MKVNIVCSECQCFFNICNNNEFLTNNIKCKNCIKDICCCISIHIKRVIKKSLPLSPNFSVKSKRKLFFDTTKNMYPAALGIEILCIMAAEIGENIGLYTFGFNLLGIMLAYIIGYALAGFTTFMTILGRYSFSTNNNNIKIKGCCSLLEQQSHKGFLPNMLFTFKGFITGFRKFPDLQRQSNLKLILKFDYLGYC